MAIATPRRLVPIEIEPGCKDYPGSVTLYVILACVLAASGGLMFGYDIGISGGVDAMEEFQDKFFPEIARKEHRYAKETDYCYYNNYWLQTATSVLYLAALIFTFLASWVTDKYGRRVTMLLGGVVSIVGAGLAGGAQNLSMLIVGRALMGCGIGFANQVVPLYSSEMAPAKWRGSLNILFQLGITIGIFIANMVNYVTHKIIPAVAWRISLVGAAAPAMLLALGGLLLPDSPLSLIRRGLLKDALTVLQRIRGTTQVLVEFQDIQTSSDEAQAITHPFQNILKRHNRPQLVISIAMMFFQQLSGINAVMFYVPVILHTLGYGKEASLYSTVITGAVNLVATIVSILAVDKLGRRCLLLIGGLQMFVCQIGMGVVLRVRDLREGQTEMSHPFSITVVVLVCMFVAAFAWSWGPLSWLLPSEILNVDTRSAGQSIAVSVNMLFTFLVAQFFLTSLCAMQWGIFLFFAAWVFVMQMFVLLFVPETKGMQISFMDLVWKQHWYWKRFMRPRSEERSSSSFSGIQSFGF